MTKSLDSPSAPTAEASPRRMLFLDALRGLAALAVAVQHIYASLPTEGTSTPPWLHSLFMFGSNGVAVFFVLSGCVIPYAIGSAEVTPRYVARFIARRFVRLDVPYWICIAAYLLAARLMGKHTYDDVTAGDLVANLFYLNFILELDTVVAVGWTLAIEIQFYLAYLVLLGLSQRLERWGMPGRIGVSRLLVFTPPLLVSLLWQLKVIPDPAGPDHWFLQPWLFFFCGATITWALARTSPTWPIAVCIAALGVTGVATGESANITAAVTGVVIWIVASRGLMNRIGISRPLQWLGTISYSLYLLHPLVGNRPIRLLASTIAAPWTTTTHVLAFCGGIIASIIVASVFCIVVERPSQRLARKIPLRR